MTSKDLIAQVQYNEKEAQEKSLNSGVLIKCYITAIITTLPAAAHLGKRDRSMAITSQSTLLLNHRYFNSRAHTGTGTRLDIKSPDPMQCLCRTREDLRTAPIYLCRCVNQCMRIPLWHFEFFRFF
ncbi:unnamed protein product [Pieris brassicae]|uniref:Uncharacterized protein n=1 Tax=Pieris brassicae TaxID=7116 RepID=A0A9P0TJ02_PIEBR|nr:unnamed protein product [Pieris brassicae]